MADQKKEEHKDRMDIGYVEKRYSFAQKEQWVQKFFMGAIFIFLALGVLGFFGSGYLSEKTVSSSMYDIEYQQYIREDTTTDLYINFKNPADTTVVSIPVSYIKQVKVEQITPEPESVTIENNRLYYSFSTKNSGGVAFYLNPEWSGSQQLELGIQDEIVTLNQFVYF